MNFIRALGLRDVVLMNIVAVVGMRWIARGARTGPPSVTLWALAGRPRGPESLLVERLRAARRPQSAAGDA